MEEGLAIPALGRSSSTIAPIKAMRTPDKKAGDIGDIQFRSSSFVDKKGERFIEYAIDAKYRKSISEFEIDRLKVHLGDEQTPQPFLIQFDFIGLDTPPSQGIVCV